MFNEQNRHRKWNYRSLKGAGGQSGLYCHGEKLFQKAQDIFVDEWLKDALCSLKPLISADSLIRADEVIYKLRGVVLEARHTGLVKARNFQNG